MTFTQRIAALIGGVSQRPQSQRSSGQADAQTNALNHQLRGLLKRPPLSHFAKLGADVTGLSSGFTHDIDLSTTERFIALIRNGVVSVFDKMSGAAVEVSILNADSYVTPVVAAEIVLVDSFTDAVATTLSNHGDWTTLNASTEATIQTNGTSTKARMNLTGSGASLYRHGFLPPQANYTVTADALFESNTSELAHVDARVSSTDLSGYQAHFVNQVAQCAVSIRRSNAAGALTVLASANVPGNIAGVTQSIGIRVTGTLIEALLNGVVATSFTDATYAAAGRIGLGGNSAGAGFGSGANVYLDNFTFTYTPATTGQPPFKAVQVGKQTVIANTTVDVRRGTTSAPNKAYQALVAIRQADYGTQYSLTLNGHRIGLGSPEGVTPQARVEIDTTFMAERLKDLIDDNNTLDGFTITQYGSSLLVAKTDGSDFAIAADDGLADNGLIVIKGSVQSFTDLPTKGPDGFTVEVTGDVSNEFDNYFVRFDVTDTATNAGVWKECVKPGEPISLAASTLPHVLTYKGSFVPASEAEGTPPSPTIVPGGGTVITDRWDEAGGLNSKILINGLGDHVNCTLNNANGIETEYTVYYDVDTRNADATDLASIVLEYETGGIGSDVWTEATRISYGPEVLLNNQSISAVLIRQVNERIRLSIKYASGGQPAADALAEFRTVAFNPFFALTGAGNKNSTAIVYRLRTGKLVTFPATQIYPQGALIRLTCDGVNFDYTPVTDVTGAAVAIQLKTQIDAHATFVATNPNSGEILVTRADAANTTVTPAITWSELTKYHDPDLAMVASGLIGKTIRNLTDNSQGTVTANTSTTISVAALTGGSDNSFHKGDRIEVVSTGRYFTLGQGDWARRVTGDLISNPMPSFVDQRINDVLITKGRLGFVSGGNIVLSEVGNLFNVFRTTVTQLLDGDPIDVKPAHGEAVRFHSYSAWDGRDIFWSGRHQFELSGEPLLSPKTVKLLPISEYPMDAIRPVVLGRFAYFVTKREGFAQVWAYGVADGSHKPEALNLTRDVSKYLSGSVLAIAGDEDLGVFFVLTDADRSKLYVHTYDRAAQQFAWATWQFPAGTTVVGMSLLYGVLTVLSEHTDGAYLDTMDLEDSDTIGLLDRKKDYSGGTLSGGNTTWTLPYSCATDGSQGVIVVQNASTGALITTTRPTATTVRAVGDFSTTAVIIGITYTLSHTLSTIFQRVPAGGGNERVVTDGRLQLSRLKVHYEDSRDFTVTVTPISRTARAYTLDASVDTDGFLSVPVMCRNQDALIVITNAEPNACRIIDVEWEGNHYSRSRSA